MGLLNPGSGDLFLGFPVWRPTAYTALVGNVRAKWMARRAGSLMSSSRDGFRSFRLSSGNGNL